MGQDLNPRLYQGTPYILSTSSRLPQWLDKIAEAEAEKKAVNWHEDEVFNTEQLGESEEGEHEYVGEQTDREIGKWKPTSASFTHADDVKDTSSRNVELRKSYKVTESDKEHIHKSQKEKQEVFKQIHLSSHEKSERISDITIDSGNDLAYLSDNQQMMNLAKTLIKKGFIKNNLKTLLGKNFGKAQTLSFIECHIDTLNSCIMLNASKWGNNDKELLEQVKKIATSGGQIENVKTILSENYGYDRVDIFLKEALDNITKMFDMSNIKESQNVHLKNIGVKLAKEKPVTICRYASKLKKLAYTKLTEGQTLNDIKEDLKKKYGDKEFDNFYSKEGNQLEDIEHKIGRLYLDASIYDTYDELSKHAKKFIERGIFLLKKGGICNSDDSDIPKRLGMFLVNDPFNITYNEGKKILAQVAKINILSKKKLEAYTQQLEKDVSNLPMIKMMFKDLAYSVRIAGDASKRASQGTVKDDNKDIAEVFKNSHFVVQEDKKKNDDFDIAFGHAV